jgi:hypothetical protein
METLASGFAAPANADNTAPVANAEADADASATPSDGPAPSVPEADTPETKRDKVQERFDKLTREKYEGLSRADRAEYRAQLAEQRLAAIEAQQAQTKQVAPANDFPTLEKFGYDEAAYNAAVAAHYSKLATEQARTVAQEQIRAEREAEQQSKVHESWAKKEAEFIKSKPDYVEKVKMADKLPISHEMQRALMGSEFGPQVALHLVENADKAAAIMRLPLAEQMRELGRIEARFEAQKAAPKPAVSQAPSPVTKIEAGDSSPPFDPSSPDSDKLSDAEWKRRREKQIQRKRS